MDVLPSRLIIDVPILQGKLATIDNVTLACHCIEAVFQFQTLENIIDDMVSTDYLDLYSPPKTCQCDVSYICGDCNLLANQQSHAYTLIMDVGAYMQTEFSALPPIYHIHRPNLSIMAKYVGGTSFTIDFIQNVNRGAMQNAIPVQSTAGRSTLPNRLV